MIKVDSVTRKYNEFVAVNNVSFEIPAGQIVGLLGHNGAGKTTLMKIITGFLEANSGQISIAGKTISENEISYKSLIGYLPENAPSYGELSVAEYLEFSASLKNVKSPSEKIRKAMLRVGLSERVNQKISTLSKGYQQRVGVAQAILDEPQILILDEPTNGLDPNQIQEMRNLIKEVAKNSTVIISTHIMQEVEAICDRVLILNRGVLVVDRLLSELKSSGQLALEYSGDLQKVLSLSKELGIELIKENGSEILFKNPEDRKNITQFVKKLVDSKIDIYSVYQTHASLEEVFKEVTK